MAESTRRIKAKAWLMDEKRKEKGTRSVGRVTDLFLRIVISINNSVKSFATESSPSPLKQREA